MFSANVDTKMAMSTSLYSRVKHATRTCLSRRATSLLKSLRTARVKQRGMRCWRSWLNHMVSVLPACYTVMRATRCTSFIANSIFAVTVAMAAFPSHARLMALKKKLAPSKAKVTATNKIATTQPFSIFIACAKCPIKLNSLTATWSSASTARTGSITSIYCLQCSQNNSMKNSYLYVAGACPRLVRFRKFYPMLTSFISHAARRFRCATRMK